MRTPALVTAVLAVVFPTLVVTMATEASAATPPTSGGYFSLVPNGHFDALPNDAAAAALVHRSVWEPRPENDVANHTTPPAGVSTAGYSGMLNHGKVFGRVTGNFTGTTDEIIQWAACKWGISDNLLRAIADQESTWYESQVTSTGRCVNEYGCGDMVTSPTKETRLFCRTISGYGHDYQADYGPGRCPETFGLTGVMSWESPSWGRMPGNQNGTFPFNRDSTAFAADYLGAHLRGCLEGWEWWLGTTGTKSYSKGQLWGCVGAWYAGAWHTNGANAYINRVHRSLVDRPWLERGWPEVRAHCPAGRTCTGSRPPGNPSS
jgi:hypothetical protein